MSERIATTGLELLVHTPITFPIGFTITEFADDGDSLTGDPIQIGESAKNVNGTKVDWSTPAIITKTINLIPASQDDQNMALIFDSNRVSVNKAITGESMTWILTYPNGSVITFTGGSVNTYDFGLDALQTGRLKSKSYSVDFENAVWTSP